MCIFWTAEKKIKFSISRSLEGGVVEHTSTLSSTELDIINTVITEKALRVIFGIVESALGNLKTCMRAVNRQPMFTARGTRRAFSFSIYVSCSITRVLHYNKDSWTTTIKQPNNQKTSSGMENVENFGFSFSILGNLKIINVRSKTLRAAPYAS